MKTKHIYSAAFAVALMGMASGCSSENLLESSDTETGAGQVTISASIPENSTRLAFNDANVTSGTNTLLWESGDALQVVGMSGSTKQGNQSYGIQTGANSKSATFSGTPISGSTSYNIYYPSNVTVDAAGNATLGMDGQSQSGDNTTTHLKNYIFLAKTGVTAITQPVQLAMQNSIMKFALSGLPSDLGTLTRLTWIVETATGTQTLSLGLSGVTISASKTDLTAFLCFNPAVMNIKAGGLFTVVLEGSKSYQASHTFTTAKTYDISKRYTVTINGTAANGTTAWTETEDVINYTQADAAATGVEPTLNNGVYEINTAANLKWLQTEDNLSGTPRKTYKLMKNVVIQTGVNWIPIGTDDTDLGKPFQDTFDGNGKTVSGLNCNSGKRVGLFGYVASAAIKNLTITGGTVTGTTNYAYAGGLVGKAASSSLVNCKVTLTEVSSSGSTGCIVGGLCGMASGDTRIYGCTSEVQTINNPSASNAPTAGGLIGACLQASVYTCIANCGTIACTNGYAGGLIGFFDSDTENYVKGCISKSSSITGTTKGGLFGNASKPYDTYYINQCWYLSGTNVPTQVAGGTTTALENVGSVTSISDFSGKIYGMTTAASETSYFNFSYAEGADTSTNLPIIKVYNPK